MNSTRPVVSLIKYSTLWLPQFSKWDPTIRGVGYGPVAPAVSNALPKKVITSYSCRRLWEKWLVYTADAFVGIIPRNHFQSTAWIMVIQNWRPLDLPFPHPLLLQSQKKLSRYCISFLFFILPTLKTSPLLYPPEEVTRYPWKLPRK